LLSPLQSILIIHTSSSLALGPPKGSLAAFVAQQRTLQAKHSFSLCVSVGDFFGGSQTTPDQEQELDDLLAGRLDGASAFDNSP
jgi:hypothetical protein